MKILFLQRQARGGMIAYANHATCALRDRGVDVDVLDASMWIPNETDPSTDRKVSDQLREIASDYDIVHAWGYRCAWACAGAFSDKEAWVYSAHDVPKTTHRLLIERLNKSQCGFCSSRAVFRPLDEALAMDLDILHPGVPPPDNAYRRDISREHFAVPVEKLIIGAAGEFTAAKGFLPLIEAMQGPIRERDDVELWIAGEGPESDALRTAASMLTGQPKIRFFDWQHDIQTWLFALDLLVVPSARAGFSMLGLEAMSLGVPIMVRNAGGLKELIDPDISGFLFGNDEELATLLAEVADLPLTLESVGHGGRIRAMDQFGIDRVGERMQEVYARLVGGG